MDLFILIILSIVTLRFLDKRSKIAFVSHSVLFAVLLFLSLFTTNISWVAESMSSACGSAAYTALREALIGPAGAVFSAFYIIIMLEIVYIAFLIAASFLRAYKRIEEFRIKTNFDKKDTEKTTFVCRIFSFFKKPVFIRYCRFIS